MNKIEKPLRIQGNAPYDSMDQMAGIESVTATKSDPQFLTCPAYQAKDALMKGTFNVWRMCDGKSNE
ncbi:MAG: hypothetical protein L0Z73_05760 [Gammaproteobacteria bacterium]|nr:hypothetical protein [Gammaproteobacteria bacterium]